MDQQAPRSASRTILVTLCVAVVGTALVLIALNAWMNQTGGNAVFKDRYVDGYKDGYNKARSRAPDLAGVVPGVEMTRFTGVVVSVGADGLVVKQLDIDTDPVVDGVSDERNISVTADTKIFLRTEKDQATQEAEQRAFEAASNRDIEPPSMYMQLEVKLSDITVGSRILVVSASPVRLAQDIVATQLMIGK